MSTVIHVVFKDVEIQRKVCEELKSRDFSVSEEREGFGPEDLLLTDDVNLFMFLGEDSPYRGTYISEKKVDFDSVMSSFNDLTEER